MKATCSVAMLGLALALAASAVAAPPTTAASVGLKVSKETTYFTKPLTKRGFVDYGAALNETLREGVTVANNAALELIPALGPATQGKATPEKFYELLGIAPLPKEGSYFIDLAPYLEQKGISKPDPRYYDIDLQQYSAATTPWTARQYPELAGWMAANEKPFNRLLTSTQRTRFFAPIVLSHGQPDEPAGLLAVNLPGLNFRTLGRAMTVRGMLSVGSGKVDEGWKCLLAVHRMGRLLGQGPTLIEGLLGQGSNRYAMESDVGLLDGTRLDSGRAMRYLREFDALPRLAVLSDKIDLGERCCTLDLIQTLARGDKSVEGVFDDPAFGNVLTLARESKPGDIDWNAALRETNEFYDRYVAAMRMEDRVKQKAAHDAVATELATFARSSSGDDLRQALRDAKSPAEGRGKTLARRLLSVVGPAYEKAQQSSDRAEQERHLTRLAFALQAYRDDMKKYPASLSLLAPKYLDPIPEDLFTGKPLIYKPSKSGYLLYSVGPNGRDEDGRWFSGSPPGDDVGIQSPPPKK